MASLNLKFGGGDKCPICKKTVYATEKLAVDNKTFHKACFKCDTCKVTLNKTNFVALNEKYFCNTHKPAGQNVLKANSTAGLNTTTTQSTLISNQAMDPKLPEQVIEGKLVKLGYSFPEKWQKRFFRIVGNEIHYWKKQKEADAHKKFHVIPIAPFSEASIVHTGIERRAGNAVGWSVRSGGIYIYPVIKKQHCFKIESPEKVGSVYSRTWYLMAESDQQRDMWVDALKAKITTLATSNEGRAVIADRFRRAMQEVGMDDHEIKQLYNVQLLDQTKPQENMLNVASLVMATAVTLPVGQAGLLVVKSFDNSPAAIAGLRPQEDLILSINGQPIALDFKDAERLYTQLTQSTLEAQGTLELVVRNRFTYQQRNVTIKPFKGAHPGINGFVYAHVVGALAPQQYQQPYPQAQPLNVQPVYQAPPPQNSFGVSTTPQTDDEHHEGEVVTDAQQVQQHYNLQRKTTLHQLAHQLRQFNQ